MRVSFVNLPPQLLISRLSAPLRCIYSRGLCKAKSAHCFIVLSKLLMLATFLHPVILGAFAVLSPNNCCQPPKCSRTWQQKPKGEAMEKIYCHPTGLPSSRPSPPLRLQPPLVAVEPNPCSCEAKSKTPSNYSRRRSPHCRSFVRLGEISFKNSQTTHSIRYKG